MRRAIEKCPARRSSSSSTSDGVEELCFVIDEYTGCTGSNIGVSECVEVDFTTDRRRASCCAFSSLKDIALLGWSIACCSDNSVSVYIQLLLAMTTEQCP